MARTARIAEALAVLLVASAARASPQLTPSIKILAEERYDTDQVFRNETGTAGQFMSRLTPEIAGRIEDHLYLLEGFYAADFRLRTASGVFSWEHRSGIAFASDPSPNVKIKAEGKFWAVSDPTSLPRLGLARTFGPIVYGRALLSADARLTERLFLRPGYQFEGAHVLDGLHPVGIVNAPYVGLWWGFNNRLQVGGEYRFQYFLLGPLGSTAHSVVAATEWRASRHFTITARLGPTWYVTPRIPGASGILPRISLELWQDIRAFNWGLTVGHDLVGASGFTAALWADYLSATVSYRIFKPLRVFGVANLFRNGRAPDEGFDFRVLNPSPGVSTGYAVEAGVEWEMVRNWALQGTFTRIVQGGVAGEDAAQLALTRNMALVRLVVTAL